MSCSLEDVKPGALLRGIVSDCAVEVVKVDWIGDQALNLTYRKPEGGPDEITLYRDDEPRLTIESRGRTWSFDGDGDALRLATEAERIALAHLFDPYLAIHTSLIDPLPHQISAVYGVMLARQPLRFLLADDPGAGKTIMAGLLIRELLARGDLERCLVVAPGGLVEQWQDELGEKFGLEFDILTREMIESSRSGNPFEDRDRLIARLDMLARDDELQQKLDRADEWDLVICDEAHRMSASCPGNEVKYTKRYRVGQRLGQRCRHLLLMTATPHNGKERDFQLFMALLDGDRFEGRFRDGVHRADASDMMRRMTKEKLLRFDARPLFPERRAYTAKYELSAKEAELYTAVTDYVREEMNRARRFAGDGDKQKRLNVGFALQILQRRLASSPAAIHSSLRRRRERLESELSEARLGTKGRRGELGEVPVAGDDWDGIDEYGQGEVDEIEERIATGATAAQTVEQLDLEIKTLMGLERQARGVLHSGRDAKWAQLSTILDGPLMTNASGARRKLIVFTEPRDTLEYLREKIQGRLGHPDAVAVIHGGIGREARRRVIERFMSDRSLLVLVANDAAGEGVNLQRGHLMVNYDLPWNPNRIEQRFGRIHRIGQTEVCHLWNLVAADTREGEVYARLLEKLEVAREALGGQVYDVLGELFEGKALKDLLFEAIEYGEREEVREKLFRQVDGAVDQKHLLELLSRHALTNDSMPEAKVGALRQEMERAEAQRLQPLHVQSFFVEAFRRLSGQIKSREVGRWEINHVPLTLRERDRQAGTGAAIQKRYERVCFEKGYIHAQPVATFIYPGHPLLEAVIGLVRERHGHLLRQGAVFIDDADSGDTPSVIALLAHDVRDARTRADGKPQIISSDLRFVAIGPDGTVTDAGIAPHLSLRPARSEETALIDDVLRADWLRDDLEQVARRFATVEMGGAHVSDVKARRVPEIDKVEREVRARLGTEINLWDSRAAELREQERAGKRTKLSSQNAARRAEDLAERLKRRLDSLKQERLISAQPPRVRGGMLVIPRGLVEARSGKRDDAEAARTIVDAAARQDIERIAMEAVMAAERRLGNEPEDVSAQKIGYDIASYDSARRLRCIEVKGRADGADRVTITRQEIITSLHEPDKFILAIVEVRDGGATEPRYVAGALDEREPPFEQTAIQFKMKNLLERAEEPK